MQVPSETVKKLFFERGIASARDDTKYRATSSHHASSLQDRSQNCKRTGTHVALVSEISFLFEDNAPHTITVGQIGSLDNTTDIPVRGDPVRGSPELFICPEVQTVDSNSEISVTVSCNNPPWFMSKGTIIAQAILLPQEFPRCHRTPSIWWAEVVGKDKPTLHCKLRNGKAVAYLMGMVDTGADVTIISRAEWPKDWSIKPMDGRITGIGGSATSMRSVNNIVIEGPDGHVATVRPFVIDSGFTLWGRDLLSQWGARLEIPKPQDF